MTSPLYDYEDRWLTDQFIRLGNRLREQADKYKWAIDEFGERVNLQRHLSAISHQGGPSSDVTVHTAGFAYKLSEIRAAREYRVKADNGMEMPYEEAFLTVSTFLADVDSYLLSKAASTVPWELVRPTGIALSRLRSLRASGDDRRYKCHVSPFEILPPQWQYQYPDRNGHIQYIEPRLCTTLMIRTAGPFRV